MQYDDDGNGNPDYTSVTLAGAASTDGGVTGGTTITNLHQGEVSATSTDAVNGSQLYDVQQTASAGWNLGVNGDTTPTQVKPGDNVDFSGDGNITVSQADSGGQHDITLGLSDSITVGSSNAVTVDGDAGTVSGLTNTTFDPNATYTGGQAATQEQLSQVSDDALSWDATADGGNGAYNADHNGSGPNKIVNVADGELSATSTDAVNGSQLFEVISNVGDNLKPLTFAGDTGTDVSRKLGETVNLVGGADPTTLSDDNIGVVANGSDTLEVKLSKNIDLTRDGSVTIGDTTVRNEGLTVDDGAGNTVTVTTGGTTVANAAGDETTYGAEGMTVEGGPSVTKGGIDAGGQRITNVSPAIEDSDAATVGQIQSALGNSHAYTDRRVKSLRRDIHNLGNRLDAGVASAMAAAALPSAYRPGQSSAAIAMGEFHGEGGLAVGLSTITDNGRYVFKLNGTTNTRGDAGVGVGAAVVW